MAEGSNPEQAGISITRVFDAPRERVWREWTDLERALPRTNEIRGNNFFAVGPARVVAQVESPDACVV